MRARAVNNWYKSNELILTYLGEFESLNFSIGLPTEDIALFHALYRTSIKGRRDLIKLMFSDDLNGEVVNKIDASYTSRVAEIFNVTLKSLGIGLDFVDEDEKIKVLNDDVIKTHTLNGKVYFCTDYQFYLIERFEEIKSDVMEENPVLTKDQLYELVESEMKSRSYINGKLEDELEVLANTL